MWTDGKAPKHGRGWDVEMLRNGDDTSTRGGRELAKHRVFPMFCGSGGSKSRLAKTPGEETFGQMRNEKLHDFVVRNTFGSKKCQNTAATEHFWTEHFWTLRGRKSARRYGGKQMWKQQMSKRLRFGVLVNGEMSKKSRRSDANTFGTDKWRTHHGRTIIAILNLATAHAVLARNIFPNQNVQNT